MSRRPCGWRQDAYDPRDWHANDPVGANETRLVGAPRVSSPAGHSLLTGAPDLLHVRGPRIMQIGESCVGFTLKRALYMSHRLQGVESPVFASGLGNYTIARRQEHKLVRPLPALIDRGCRPRDCMKGVRSFGFIPESVWRDVPAHVNDGKFTPKVTTSAYSQAGDLLQFMYVTDIGSNRVAAVRQGLIKGWIPMFAIVVDQAYMDHVGSDAIDRIDPTQVLGGHYQAVLKVETDDTLLTDNWWDDTWGFNDGMGRIHPNLFGSPYISDVILLKSVPAWG